MSINLDTLRVYYGDAPALRDIETGVLTLSVLPEAGSDVAAFLSLFARSDEATREHVDILLEWKKGKIAGNVLQRFALWGVEDGTIGKKRLLRDTTIQFMRKRLRDPEPEDPELDLLVDETNGDADAYVAPAKRPRPPSPARTELDGDDDDEELFFTPKKK